MLSNSTSVKIPGWILFRHHLLNWKKSADSMPRQPHLGCHHLIHNALHFKERAAFHHGSHHRGSTGRRRNGSDKACKSKNSLNVYSFSVSKSFGLWCLRAFWNTWEALPGILTYSALSPSLGCHLPSPIK